MAINSIGSGSALGQTISNVQRSSERIASGSQINSAADDAAGLAISNRLSSQINELSQAQRNASDGISFLQVAGGALSSITDGLARIRELSLQASNGTLNNSDRSALNSEAISLKDEITGIVETTRFNGQTILNNDSSVGIQLGGSNEDNIQVGVQSFADILQSTNFQGLDISNIEGAEATLGIVDEIQGQVNSSMGDIGAQLNRLDSSISSLFSSQINTTEARSRINDADIAKEITDLTTNNIKKEVAIALQAQANIDAKNVLKLLEF
jgi:flagellin